MTLTAFLAFLLTLVPGRSAAADSPEAPDIAVTLRADKTRYHLAETIRLTVVFGNNGSQPVEGYLCAAVWCDATTVLYRRASTTFVPYGYPPFVVEDESGLSTMELCFDPFRRTLEPGAEVRHELRLVLDGNTGGPVLSSPGQYELQVHYQDTLGGHEVSVASNVVRVQATPAPGEDPAAFLAYRRLLRFVQHPTLWGNPIDVPADFVEAYAGSAYVAVVRRAQLLALRRKVQSGKASPAEQEFFRKLKDKFP